MSKHYAKLVKKNKRNNDYCFIFRVLNITYTSVNLSWTPGFDGGYEQSFKIRQERKKEREREREKEEKERERERERKREERERERERMCVCV